MSLTSTGYRISTATLRRRWFYKDATTSMSSFFSHHCGHSRNTVVITVPGSSRLILVVTVIPALMMKVGTSTEEFLSKTFC